MDPEDLPSFTDLVVTNLNQRQKIFCRAPISLIRWHLENMYGAIEVMDENSFKVFNTVTISSSEDGNYLHLEWKGDAVNDMIADSVLAVIIQSESSPASVKGKLFVLVRSQRWKINMRFKQQNPPIIIITSMEKTRLMTKISNHNPHSWMIANGSKV